MRELNFTIKGQKLFKNGDFSGIVRGSKHYLKCRFDIPDSEWIGCTKAAMFWSADDTYVSRIVAGECSIPDEITDNRNFKMKVIGVNGDLVITTNTILISQEE